MVFGWESLYDIRLGQILRQPLATEVWTLTLRNLELALHPVQAIGHPFARATPLLRPSPPDPCGRSVQSEDLGRRVKELFGPGRQRGQGALVARAQSFSATDRLAAVQTPRRRTSYRPSPGEVRKTVTKYDPDLVHGLAVRPRSSYPSDSRRMICERFW